jgi:hypothetical protein
MEVALMFKTRIWGRDFNLKVVYDCYIGEEIIEEQKEALKEFVANRNLIESSKDTVEQYCLKKNKREIGSDKITNIFKYVIPESIFVKRDCRVAIMCRYKFDAEHGIAVVYKQGKLKEVGSQDIIL